MRSANPRNLFLSAALLLLLAACQLIDPQQQAICQRLIGAYLDSGDRVTLLSARAWQNPGGAAVELRLDYRITPPAAAARDHWLRCRFAGGTWDPGRLDLVAVARDQGDAPLGVWLTPMDLAVLKIWMQVTRSRPLVIAAPLASIGAAKKALLYAGQTLLNALVVCAVYMLLAAGYALIYSLLERINLAFGHLTLVAGYGGVLGLLFALTGAGLALPLALVIMFAAAMALGGLLTGVLARQIMLPVARRPSQVSLIVTLGLAFALQEFLRLSLGGRDLWLPPLLPGGFLLLEAGAWSLSLSFAQLLVSGVTFFALSLLLWLYQRRPMGLVLRGCADDPLAASLLGVSFSRVVRQAFVLSGLLAGLAGALVVFYYGNIGFTGGSLLGFKALTAAILGGIGSLPGALAGGVIIGLTETVWSAYLPGEHRDIAVFSLLILVLIYRPQGLFGKGQDPLLGGP